MWVTAHFLSGSAAGRLLETRGAPGALTPLAGPVLHAVLDAVPHWDYTSHPRRRLWSLMDVGATAALVSWGLRRGWGLPALLTGAASAAPDLEVAHEVMPGWPRGRRLFPSHRPGFPHGRASFAKGVTIQAGTCAGALLILRARGEARRER